MKEAEKAKIALSSTTNTEIIIIGMLEDDAKNLTDVVVDLSRDQFEQMIQNDIKQSIELVHTTIKNAYLTPEQIDNVILVGGLTNIPSIRRKLADIFGEEKILNHADPQNCIALGAGILAGRVAEVTAYNGNGLIASDIAIITADSKFAVIFEKGTPYPTPEPVIVTICIADQNTRRINLPIYMSDFIAKRNELQAVARLELPKDIQLNTSVDVAFLLDEDGILEVKASLQNRTAKEIKVFTDRGINWRLLAEKELEDAKQKWDKKIVRLDRKADIYLNEIYNEAVEALNANNKDIAKETIERFEKEISKLLSISST